jgi:hypothetical protein
MNLVGLDRQFASDTAIEQSLDELFTKGWVVDQEPLIITHEGKEYFKRQNKRRWKQSNPNVDKKVMDTEEGQK